ncbi:MAG TPA: translation elongation factor Ts [Vicinamibacterales bacterium]|jgi:elongation factor Ts
MAITAEQVKALRDKTGAGMMECKTALTEAKGDIEEAITVLRKRGLAKAATRSGRATKQGAVGTYVHMPVADAAGPFGFAKLGVLVEVNCESDFVAKTDDFKTLVKELAMQVAAADPTFVTREQVPAAEVEKEKEIFRAQLAESGKPANVIEKIIEGKLGSFYERVCLMDQLSVRDGSLKVSQMIAAAVAKTGENITVARFARFKLGDVAE